MTHLHHASCACSRRAFLGAGCGAYVALALASSTGLARRAFGAVPGHDLVRTEPFARVVKVADGVWAVVSTPFGSDKPDMRTVANAGVIAGKDGVMVIEGLNTVEGGAWLSDLARELTGRRPTHVALTHYHADHSAGLAGHLGGANPPVIVGTATTRQMLLERTAKLPEPKAGDAPEPGPVSTPRVVLPDSVIVDYSGQTTVDLGGRTVRLTPHAGHSPSDLTVEIDEPRVLWTGDLVFNGMFPYYGDAVPSKLGAVCESILRDPNTLYIPGHGSPADATALKPYLAMLADVERAARDAFAKGTPAEDAWKSYEVPAALGEWYKFRPNVYQFAFEAWERELKGGEPAR